MPSLPIDNFSLGITDYVTDGPVNAAQKLDNVLLRPDGKPYQRPGIDIYNSSAPQIPPGNQRIDDLYYFDSTLFAKSGTKLYYLADGAGSWSTLGGPSSHDAFPDSELGAKCSWSEWRGHLFITPGPSTNKLSGCRTQKVFRSSTNVWTLVQAGVPRAQDTTGTNGLIGSGGANEHSYILYELWKYSYTAKVNGVDVFFVDYGKPRANQIRHEEIDTVNYPTWDGLNYSISASENYDTIRQILYRTKADETVPYFVKVSASIGSAATYNVTDANLGVTSSYNPILYTDGGVLANDPVPLCYYSLVLDNYGFYLNCTDVDNGGTSSSAGQMMHGRLLQSAPGDPDGVPAGNYVDVPGVGTGLSFVGSFPIVFTERECYRIEGRYDAFGGGGMRAKLIGNEGCLSGNAIVRTPTGVYFPSRNGWCWTDGFQVINLSMHLPNTYSALQNKSRMHGTFDSKVGHAYFAVESTELSSDTGKNNALFILDAKKSQADWGVFTTASSDGNLQPNSVHYDSKNERFLIGDQRGYVFKFDATKYNDPVVNTATAYSTWARKAVVWDIITVALGFGTTTYEKWCTRLGIVAKNITGKLSAQLYSYNDQKTAAQELQLVRERTTTSSGLHRVWRRFRRLGLRATYKQVQAKKGFVVIARSDDHATVTGNSGARTALLAAGTWPEDGTQDLVGHTIYFDNDSYAYGWTISADSGNTLTCSAGAGTFPNTAGVKWVVKGYPKEEGFELQALDIEYDVIGEATQGFKAADEGGNS